MAQSVPVIYVEPSGEEKEVQAEIGKNLLDIAHENDIELEGACHHRFASFRLMGRSYIMHYEERWLDITIDLLIVCTTILY